MGDHLVLHVGHAARPGAIESVQNVEHSGSSIDSVKIPITSAAFFANKYASSEEDPLLQMLECRICQEEDYIDNLESPCACSGSLKYAHRTCVQRWCDEKGDIKCEICHQQYRPDYTAPALPEPDETIIEISEGWTIAGTPLDLNDPRLLAMAAAQRHFIESEYDEYSATNASGAAFCRSAALILMALLILRHALNFSDGDGDDDASAIFSLFLLRAAGFLLPCYIVAWAISILQRRRERQEAATLAATEVAFILQSAQGRAFQFPIIPDSPMTPQQEPYH